MRWISIDYRDAADELSSKEVSKLQNVVSKNHVHILRYGLKVHPEKIIQHLITQIEDQKTKVTFKDSTT